MTNTIDATREFTVSRVYRAPLELVLEMWSKPERITNWWGPHGFSTTTHEMDFRPGGIWKFTMHGPDGTDYQNIIRYVETGPERIVYDHGGEGDPVRFHVVVDLQEIEGGKTKMDFRLIFPSAEERKRVVETYGADKGLAETTTRLDTLLADEQASQSPFRMHLSVPSDTEIRTVRSFRAPRQLVFDAFTKPEHIRNWMGPYKYECSECSYDPRPGGKWHMVHEGDGHAFRFHGEVLEINAPERVVSTFEFEGMPGMVQTNTTLFEEVGGLTRVTTISAYDSKEARDGMLNSGMEWGMGQGYDRLDTLVMFAHEDAEHPRFKISRTFDAPRELVWSAWSEADRFARWWGPKGCKIHIAEFDFQPGGRIHYSIEGGMGDHGKLWGRFDYRDIAAVDRLEFVNGFADEHGGIVPAPIFDHWPLGVLTVVTLTEENGKTLLQLEGIPLSASQVELDRFESMMASMQGGFAGTFDQLEQYLKEEQA